MTHTIRSQAGNLFFSCMSDQAVDFGVIEEEIVFIRTLENGLAVNKYVTKQRVEKSDANVSFLVL